MSYDSLSVYQWASGFITIIREEQSHEVKDQMLEYLSKIMDDAQDFDWSAAKGSHAVLLCRMEKNKVNWKQTDKIDRIRRAHAQKISSQAPNFNGKKLRSDSNGPPCCFYQNNSCPQKGDHNTAGYTYKHVCAICFGFRKKFNHPAAECKTLKNSASKQAKNE